MALLIGTIMRGELEMHKNTFSVGKHGPTVPIEYVAGLVIFASVVGSAAAAQGVPPTPGDYVCTDPRAPVILSMSLGNRKDCVSASYLDPDKPNASGVYFRNDLPGLVLNVANGLTGGGSTDAINGGQLNTIASSIASGLGATSSYDPRSGQVTRPAYNLQGGTFDDVGSALTVLDTGASGASSRAEAAQGAAAAASSSAAVAREAAGAAATIAEQAQATAKTALDRADVAQSTGSAALTVATNSVQYDNTARTSVTVGGEAGGAPVLFRNIAAGTSATDAVNLGQLQASLMNSRTYTDEQLSSVRFDLRRLARSTQAGEARNAALAGMPQVITPGASMIGASMGGAGSALAFAVGASKAFSDQRTLAKAAASYASRTKQVTWNVGMGYQF
jgi:autotransporter adhesin